MTLITDVLARAARQTSVAAPSAWLSATADEHVEIRDDFLLETVDDVLSRVDFPSPLGAQTIIVGDGSETYAMPTNFLRLQRDKFAVYDASLDRPVEPITTEGQWVYLKDLGAAGVARYYRTTGYPGAFSLSFYGFPSSGVSITVNYMTTNWKATAAGVPGCEFTNSEDVTIIPRRILESGIVWRWRERKGLPYQDKYMEYEALITRMANDYSGRRSISFGGQDHVRWQDLVPAFIPAS